MAPDETAEVESSEGPEANDVAPVERAPPDRRFLLGLLGIVVVGVGARLAYVEAVGRHVKLGLDAIAYELLGSELAAGIGYVNPGTLFSHHRKATANFPPGYPLFIAGLDKLRLTSSVDVELVGAVLGGVTVLGTGLLARRITGRPGVGLLAAALVAVSPTLIASSGSSMSESLSVPLTVLVLLAACWAARASSVLPWVVVGLTAGLLVLVRSEDLLVAVLLVPAAIVVTPGRSWRWRGVGVALALVAALAVIGPWTVRNEETFHPHVLLSTNGGKTLAGANCRSTYYGSLMGAWDFRCWDTIAWPTPTRPAPTSCCEPRESGTSARTWADWPWYSRCECCERGVSTPPSRRRTSTDSDAAQRRLAGAGLAGAGAQLGDGTGGDGPPAPRRAGARARGGAGACSPPSVVLVSFGNDRYVLSAVPSLCSPPPCPWSRPAAGSASG